MLVIKLKNGSVFKVEDCLYGHYPREIELVEGEHYEVIDLDKLEQSMMAKQEEPKDWLKPEPYKSTFNEGGDTIWPTATDTQTVSGHSAYSKVSSRLDWLRELLWWS